jgi:hypothetical protein
MGDLLTLCSICGDRAVSEPHICSEKTAYVEPDDQVLQPPILTSYATRTMAGDIEDARRWYDAQAHQLWARRLLRELLEALAAGEEHSNVPRQAEPWLQREREMHG